ncbi:MAG: zinc ribbon domain-containing protein [Anaerolineae bacterium]|nr:zinc ribbon domain-containing protein [Anaerolineae bacterium]
MAAEYTLQDLYEEYVFQREHRVSSHQALQLLREMAPQVLARDGAKLARMIQQWEAQYTSASHAAPRPAAAPDPFMAEVSLPGATLPAHAAGPSDDEQTRPTTKMGRSLLCPHCEKENPLESKYCYSCGTLLVVLGGTATLYEEVEDSSIFGKMAVLTLVVRGFEQQPIRVQVGEQALVMGRHEHGSKIAVDIDLQPYGAQEMGVSRRTMLGWNARTRP